MKTAKPSATASDAAPNRRQPVRQTRTNPPRSSATSGRGAGRDRDGASGAAQEQPIDIFPGVTHFADAISALPKELVKHFTLLKEVDAKIHVPQQALFQLINTALRQPVPNSTRSPYDGSTAAASAPASAQMTAQNSNAGDSSSAAANGQPAQTQAGGTEAATASAFDPSNLRRRHLFRQVAIEIREMLVALEEKNHVISTANDALNKQMGRIDDVWPHLELEFSEEAKWGSDTHWAYPENRAASRATNNAQQAERSRREGAANLSAAAQQIAEEAAARSDARKQAVAARRSQKAAQQANHDSDADDLHHKAEARKHGGGTKSRKPLPDPAAVAAGVSLGALSGAAGAASAMPTAPKRRKVEKPAPTSAPMERALSGVYGSAAGTSSKGRTSSPRESPAPDGGKKRKALPSGGNAAKKRYAHSRFLVAFILLLTFPYHSRNTASATSSPVVGAFFDPVTNVRASPAPSNIGFHTSESLIRSASQSGAYSGATIPTIPSYIQTTAVLAKKITDTDKETPGAKKLGPGDKGSHVPVIGGTTTSSANTASSAGIPSGLTAAVIPNTAAVNIPGSSTTANTNSSNVANALTGAANPPAVASAASATSTPVVPILENKNNDKDVSTSTVPGPSGSQARVVSPAVENRIEAQLKAENSKQRTSPLAPAAEVKPNTGPSAAPSSTTNTGAHTYPRAPVDKPSKVSPIPTPVPAPVATPASSHPPAAIASPAKVQVPKVEATEASSSVSSVSAVPMTRTRSAGGAKKEAAPPSAPLAPSSAAAPATPTTPGASNAKPSTETATPVGRPTSSAAAPASSAATKKESTPVSSASVLSTQPPSVTTKSGRASKPSTPSIATFAESTTRSRPSRSSEPASSNGNNSSSTGNGSGSGGAGGGSAKRSHKKGASSISSNAHTKDGGHNRDHHRNHSSVAAGDGHGNSNSAGAGGAGHNGGNGTGSGSDVSSGSSSSRSLQQRQQKQKQGQQKQQQQQHQQQVDDNDPLYCYCQQVSFGEMIACDADDCEREWFHLECAGLRVAPKTNGESYPFCSLFLSLSFVLCPRC